ncbi:MAG TPA: D-2-hydroxyacid dehydrogenase family protein [Magnetospirillaceae bacterium]|jgi:phosphoglycerate dehydrogenase-like enzyme
MHQVNVAVLDDYQEAANSCADWSVLGADARVVFFRDHVADFDALAARLQPFNVVVAMRERTAFSAERIAKLPNLKLIVTVGTWNAAIDMQAAQAKGIVVSGTSGGGPKGPATVTWALLLAITRNLVQEAASLRAGGWQWGLGTELDGKILGLLGLGTIGQIVARFGQAFGMTTISWSHNLTTEKAKSAGVEYVSKDELFRRSDVVSVHLKLGDRTRGIVGERELGLMKSTAYLVNTSRGPIVSESALISALQNRRIAGAALDVFDEEPLLPSHPFRFLPNVLATPHIGYVSLETYRLVFPQIVEDIQAWFSGTPIRVLNP